MVLKASFQLQSGHTIGPGSPAYIIAEIGSNHDGSLDKAKRLIEAAKTAGANAAKFQSFQVHGLINRQRLNNHAWEPHPAWDILDRLTLPADWHGELKTFCDDLGIDFLSAPFDAERLALLNDLNIPAIKIASGDLTHHAFLREVGQLRKPVFLSTGMAYLAEVRAAVNILTQAGCTELALLHCVSLYPPVFAEANIRAMVTLASTFQVPVGYSDHAPGHTVPLGAVALGASVIEKHLTDDKTAPGPDHPYALDVPEFTAMVREIRNLEAALGNGVKAPSPGEVPERVGARRGIYSAVSLQQGAVLTPDMLKAVRHAYEGGIPATDWDTTLSKRLNRDLPPDTLLTSDMLSS